MKSFLFTLFVCINMVWTAEKPNVILIFTDDQGYADLSCFGGTHIETPHIDQLASEGIRLTDFYVAAPVCTPSRAALMTGCYPKRIDMARGSTHSVLLAGDNKGLNPSETTIAEVLKTEGYATAIIGKWHLGDQRDFLPTRQGFDYFYGIPYSHDIHPFHPRNDYYKFPALPFLENEKVIEMDPNADFLTKRITEKSIEFIVDNKDKPFFLYIPHPIPHKPLHISPKTMASVDAEIRKELQKEALTGKINYELRNKLFRQAISEIDNSVHAIVETLKRLRIDEKTMIIFSSDNGPAVGKAFPLSGKKGSVLEGGMRVPTFIRWPSKIPAKKISSELLTTMDLLPTLAHVAGASLPRNKIDGKNILPVLLGEGTSPHEYFFYYGGNELRAVRAAQWKLHIKGNKAKALYDLSVDIGEKKNLLKKRASIGEKLLAAARRFSKHIEKNVRPAAYIDKPVVLTK